MSSNGEAQETENLFDALERGDIVEAVIQLRHLKCLYEADIRRLADFLDEDPMLVNFHEFKLIPKRRRAGKPTRLKFEQKAVALARGRSLESEYQRVGNLEAAIATLMKQHGVKRSTLLADRALWKKTRTPKSPIK